MIDRNKLISLIFNNSLLLQTKKVPIKRFLKLQYGGGSPLKINYEDNEYIFEHVEINGEYYAIFTQNEDECISVVIHRSDKLAEIHGLGNNPSCIKSSNTTSVGSTLLKITLKMLRKYKDKLGITKIVLTDNSLKRCGKENIILSHMMILLTGDTWSLLKLFYNFNRGLNFKFSILSFGTENMVLDHIIIAKIN
jgi:hypothetical protein